MILDHFHPPMSVQRPWEGFYSEWTTMIANHLNREVLPAGYVAIPQVRRGPAVDVDVAAFETQSTASMREPSGAAPRWTPAKPEWTGFVELADRDLFEVRVIEDKDGPRLVAAIELVSPANKDRPAQRLAFAGKCGGYLRQSVALVVVDIVTSRIENLHRRILEILELDAPDRLESSLFAGAYRTVADNGGFRLEMWTEPLSIGGSLPTLPLWLGADLAIPLDLGASYRSAREMLRIAQV